MKKHPHFSKLIRVTSVPGRPPIAIKPIAKPGKYQARLNVDGKTYTEEFEIFLNPNESYSRKETDAKFDFWMKLYAKAEEGAQTVLNARTAKEEVAALLQKAKDQKHAESKIKAMEKKAEMIDQLCDNLEGSMMATGRTLVQIISEPAKYLAKFTWLHNMMEVSEGPPTKSMIEVYELVSGGMDKTIASFNAELSKAMQQFDELTREL